MAFSPVTIGSELTANEAYNEDLDLLNIVPTNGRLKLDMPTHSTPITLQVQPNPFTYITSIIFTLPRDETVRLAIYNLAGRQIKTIEATYKAGEHFIKRDGKDNGGNPLNKELCHVRLLTANNSESVKVVTIR